MRIVFPKDAVGKKWSEALFEGDDLLDEAIPASSFPNVKVGSWFEKHPYLGGERTALRHFSEASAPIESKFYWLNKSSAKSRVAAGVMLTPNWEDSDLTKFPDYKVGIDFFMSADGDALLVVLGNEGNLRVLELTEKLSNTQIDILCDIDGAAGFDGIGDLEPQRTIHKTLWDAFALKEVNRRFYEGVASHFQILLQHLHDTSGKPAEDAKLFANRLIGRLLFIWFLRKKGFVNEGMGYFACEGVPATEYYANSLKPLFFETLNKPATERDVINGTLDAQTPFLNGGLFDARPNDWIDGAVDFPPDWFKSLYAHFEQFNFTTDESTPEYEQVAIDPEMLGRVFENLLASQLSETGKEARKASGSFYTPREIVAYMCKESLREYLYGALGGEGVREGVDRLLDMSDKDYEIKHSDAKRSLWGADRTAEMTCKALEVLDRIRVVDPACGSGAFPMGMLQLLTKVYTRLGSNLNPYDMKLRILGNSIYGIDIQPMAVEISRLRAWLSIIVDEKDSKNVRPLPNLDFKFVCANTLVPLVEDGAQATLFDTFNEESLETLDLIMGRGYYAATNPEEKKQLREEYQYAVLNLEEASNVQGSKRLKQRMAWNPFDSNHSSNFFDSKIMFNEADGFDIAIGNPPYIQLQKMKDVSAKLYKPLGYETFESTGDIYALFYERGFDLLKPNGILCYITSNKWMRAAYGGSLRDYFLKKTNPIKLIDFAGTKVFESATVDVNILLGSKAKNSGTVAAGIIRDDCHNNLSVYVKQHAVDTTFTEGE
ncbi:MAG: Eco57I restriction-modification methylase domain-containing protein, partial [Raoultibacter sp.]